MISTYSEFSEALTSLEPYGLNVYHYLTPPLVDFVKRQPHTYLVYKQLFGKSAEKWLQLVYQVLDAVAQGTEIDEQLTALCAKNDNVVLLEYFYQTGFEWNESTFINSIVFGSAKCLQFALK